MLRRRHDGKLNEAAAFLFALTAFLHNVDVSFNPLVASSYHHDFRLPPLAWEMGISAKQTVGIIRNYMQPVLSKGIIWTDDVVEARNVVRLDDPPHLLML